MDTFLSLSLSTFLLSGARKCYSFILYFPFPLPGIYHFSKELVTFYWTMVFRNQGVSARCVCCCCGVTAWSLSQWRGLMHKWNPPLSVSLYISVDIFKSFDSTLIHVTLMSTTVLILVFFFPYLSLFLQWWETWLLLSIIHWLV